MTIKDCHPKMLKDLQELGILHYVGKEEPFQNESSLIGELLLRASASALFAYKEGNLSKEEFEDSAVELEQFCSKYNYDFDEYCYGIDSIEELSEPQIGGFCI